MEEQTFKLLNKAFVLSAVLVAGILIFLAGSTFYQIKILEQQNVNQITVSGEGKVWAKPDVALISLGVKSEGKTVAEVAKDNTERMNAVIEALKNLKIEAKDIQTTNYNLYPVYETDNVYGMGGAYISSYVPVKTSTTLKGYALEQNVEVKIRDFAQIGNVLSQATATGANLAGSLQFTVDNVEKYKEEARAKAIAQAKANAENLSKESGVKLGKIINIYENYYPIYSAKAVGMGGGVAEAAPAPTIEPGQQEINVTINLTYRVK